MVTQFRLLSFYGLACLLLVVFSGSSYAQISHTGKGYHFRLKARQGETFKYQLATHQEMSNTPSEFGMQETSMSMTIKATCARINGNLLIMKTLDSPYTMNGRTFGKSTASVMKIKSDGVVVSRGYSGLPNLNLEKLYGYTLQPGKTYNLPVSIRSSSRSSVKVIEHETVKLLGFTYYKGHQSAKLQMNFKNTVTIKMKGVNTAVSQASGTETALISVTDGWPEYIKITSSSTSENPALKKSNIHASTMTMVTILERE